MDYTVKGSDIELVQEDFDLDETLDCGQAFRWERVESDYDKTYTGAFLNRSLTISQVGNKFIFHDTTVDELENVWKDYFDLDTDYGRIKKLLSADDTLSAACGFAGGIRLLKQDLWECLCSFIISQNNNIPRIKGIIKRLCEYYEGFPTAEMLACETPESLGYLRAGFRAKYIVDAAVKTAAGEIVPDEIREMPIEQAREKLMTIKGVGPKVAECVLLFGAYRREAFPQDVWIKRVMAEYYPDGLPECTGKIEGIAQQYLFHYIRNLERSAAPAC